MIFHVSSHTIYILHSGVFQYYLMFWLNWYELEIGDRKTYQVVPSIFILNYYVFIKN